MTAHMWLWLFYSIGAGVHMIVFAPALRAGWISSAKRTNTHWPLWVTDFAVMLMLLAWPLLDVWVAYGFWRQWRSKAT